MTDVINVEKSIKYLRYVITTQKDRFITEENKKVKEPLGFIRRGIYYLYTQEVKALLERKGFNYKQFKTYLQLNEMAYFDEKGDFKLCSIDNKKVRIIKLTDNFFEDQEEGKYIDISNVLNSLRNIDIKSCSDSDIEALKKEMDILKSKLVQSNIEE